ncbi:MAG: hypothetical protein NPIRA04_10770 [Nitrospirales bacterium]|nr:MAG: hypothetical protein NPIRA04_10770 [Nitrospirales bacterium]
MKTTQIVVLCMLLSLFLTYPTYSQEVSLERGITIKPKEQRVGIVSGIRGSAIKVLKGSPNHQHPLHFKDVLRKNDLILTEKNSTVELLLDTSTLVTLGPESTVTFAENAENQTIQIIQGQIQFAVSYSEHREATPFVFTTPRAKGITQGALFQIEVISANAHVAPSNNWDKPRIIKTTSSATRGIKNSPYSEEQYHIIDGTLSMIDALDPSKKVLGKTGHSLEFRNNGISMKPTMKIMQVFLDVIPTITKHESTPINGQSYLIEKQQGQVIAMENVIYGVQETVITGDEKNEERVILASANSSPLQPVAITEVDVIGSFDLPFDGEPGTLLQFRNSIIESLTQPIGQVRESTVTVDKNAKDGIDVANFVGDPTNPQNVQDAITSGQVTPLVAGETLPPTLTTLTIDAQNLSTANVALPGGIVVRTSEFTTSGQSLFKVTGRATFIDAPVNLIQSEINPDETMVGNNDILFEVLGEGALAAIGDSNPNIPEASLIRIEGAPDNEVTNAAHAVKVHSEATRTTLDPALLLATLPIIEIFNDANVNLFNDLIEIDGKAQIKPNAGFDPLILVDLNSNSLLNIMNGSLVSITNGGQLETDFLFQVMNGSQINIADGALATVSGGLAGQTELTVRGNALGIFGEGGGALNITTNNPCPAICVKAGTVPVLLTNGATLNNISVSNNFQPFIDANNNPIPIAVGPGPVNVADNVPLIIVDGPESAVNLGASQ